MHLTASIENLGQRTISKDALKMKKYLKPNKNMNNSCNKTHVKKSNVICDNKKEILLFFVRIQSNAPPSKYNPIH